MTYRALNCLLFLLWAAKRAHTEKINSSEIRIRL